jgi:hypothetical protein
MKQSEKVARTNTLSSSPSLSETVMSNQTVSTSPSEGETVLQLSDVVCAVLACVFRPDHLLVLLRY